MRYHPRLVPRPSLGSFGDPQQASIDQPDPCPGDHEGAEVPIWRSPSRQMVRVEPLASLVRTVPRRGMTDNMTEPISTRNLDRYGSAELPWSRPRDILAGDPAAAGLTFFVATVRPDGRPHSAGVGATWVDGALYFVSGPGTRKSRNLARDPSCSVSVGLPGIDLVLDGEAHRVTDESTLEALAAVYRTGGWPASVDGDALTAPYSAPSAGPAPWHLYRLTLHTAFGVATAEPHGATRWDFAH